MTSKTTTITMGELAFYAAGYDRYRTGENDQATGRIVEILEDGAVILGELVDPVSERYDAEKGVWTSDIDPSETVRVERDEYTTFSEAEAEIPGYTKGYERSS